MSERPKTKFGTLLMATGAAVVALNTTGCAGVSYSQRGPGGGISVGSGGISTQTRGAGGSHAGGSIDPRQACIGGGGSWNTGAKICLPTGGLIDMVKGVFGGGAGAPPAGGTTPTPLTEAPAAAGTAAPAAIRAKPKF